ncbi:hypothetical protein [Asanoa siamensis]|uniref:DUF4190 domain-containing protein n=1 Tax=Asanoa siamensis TaxID=926357 RepID=A0ABQ4CNJ2_9ACTN|nr:hypothetical protein [Asanoa siamensis]GIF72856.1 hypothetical protein Asi02nite_23740 [Asanoa siamensis]
MAVQGGGGPPYPVNQPRPVSVPPPPDGQQRARRVDPIAGTAFGVVHLEVPPATSGLAIGALIAGIASILVSFVVVCFGLLGAEAGWGAWAAGAFTVLAVAAGGAGVALGVLGRRQIRRVGLASSMRFEGKGLASAGLVCGILGLAIALIAFVAALTLQVAV